MSFMTVIARSCVIKTVNSTASINTANDNQTIYNDSRSSSKLGNENGFQYVVKESVRALIHSDIKRGEFSGNSDGSSSQGRWMDAISGERLGKALD